LFSSPSGDLHSLSRLQIKLSDRILDTGEITDPNPALGPHLCKGNTGLNRRLAASTKKKISTLP